MIDTHAHLNFKAFKNDYAEVIERSFTNGIRAIINVGSNFATSQRAAEIAKEFSNCYAAVGLHPIHVKDEKFEPEKFKNLIKSTNRANSELVKAIGETGLDYFHQQDNKDFQREIFLKHLELAKEFNLPVILHCRGSLENPKNAYQDLLEILQAHFSRLSASLQGVIHCFSADWQIAQRFLDPGFLIGFTGVITFSNANPELLETVAKVPLEKILIETDCPFLAPQTVRGQRCEPWHVKFTAEKIAEIKKIPVKQVFETTTANAERLLKFIYT